MPERIVVHIEDEITGKCPPCKYMDIDFSHDRTILDGFGQVHEQRYIITCSHAPVCDKKILLEGEQYD